MSAGRSPVALAEEAAEAVRGLNHVTLWASYGYVWPSDVDAVLIELGSMARRLPQAFEQAVAFLGREEAAGRMGTDNGRAAATVVEDLRVVVEFAANKAATLARFLEQARALTSHLTPVADDSQGGGPR